jgi:hypothetical protein
VSRGRAAGASQAGSRQDGQATGRTTGGQDWAIERPLLRPLPDGPFDTTLTLTPHVDRYAQVMASAGTDRAGAGSVTGPRAVRGMRGRRARKSSKEIREAVSDRG